MLSAMVCETLWWTLYINYTPGYQKFLRGLGVQEVTSQKSSGSVERIGQGAGRCQQFCLCDVTSWIPQPAQEFLITWGD